jgi:glycosyltransferase involved in cell wall biosynthesis
VPQTATPRVTIFLLCYNQSRTVDRAAESVLAQDYPNLEVILSDDASTDDSFDVMSAAADRYLGMHTVRLNRNPKNLGLVGHVNRAFELATGELLVLAAGDDYSVQGRVMSLVDRYLAHDPRPLLLHSSVRELRAGAICDVRRPPLVERKMRLLDMASAESLYIGATGCISRQLYEIFGPIKHKDAFEDLVLGFRAALLGRIAYVGNPLVDYTLGAGLSNRIDSRKGQRHERLAARAAGCATIADVIRQRSEDLEKVADQLDPEVLKSLRKRLGHELQAIRVRQAFYSGSQSVLSELGAHWNRRVMRGILAEMAFLSRNWF